MPVAGWHVWRSAFWAMPSRRPSSGQNFSKCASRQTASYFGRTCSKYFLAINAPCEHDNAIGSTSELTATEFTFATGTHYGRGPRHRLGHRKRHARGRLCRDGDRPDADEIKAVPAREQLKAVQLDVTSDAQVAACWRALTAWMCWSIAPASSCAGRNMTSRRSRKLST